MKNLLALFILLGLSFSAYTQKIIDYSFWGEGLSFINDPDGYTNVRKAPGTDSEVIYKMSDGELFGAYHKEGDPANWYVVVYFKEGRDQQGYMHRSRIQFVRDMAFFQVHEKGYQHLILKNEDSEVRITTGPFMEEEHEITRSEGYGITKIDGGRIWGTDYGMPRREIRSIQLVNDGKVLDLPQPAFGNTYEPTLDYAEVLYGDNGLILICMCNSDGAGAYGVIWVVKDGKYLGRDFSLGM